MTLLSDYLQKIARRAFPLLTLTPAILSGQAEAGGEKSATGKMLVALAESMWAAQVDRGMIRLVWDHVPGAAQYVITCGIPDRPGRPEKVSGNTKVEPNNHGAPRRMSAIARVQHPGVVHSCDLQWGDTKTLSAKASFNPVIPVVPAGTRLEAPATVTAENTGPGEITLRWTEVDGATAYTIGRTVSPDGWRGLCDLCPSKTTTYVDRRAKEKAKHTYAVSPVNARGVGSRAHSNTVIAVGSMNEVIVARDATVTAGLRAPQGVSVRATGPSSVMVSWDVWDAVRSYEVYRWFDGGTMQPVGTVARTTAVRGTIEFPDDFGRYLDLAGRLSLRYAVKAVDASGAATEATVSRPLIFDRKSANSGPKAPPAISSNQPTNLRTMVISPGAIRLSWNPPVGRVPCVISRDIDRTGFEKRATLAAGTSHYTDGGTDLVARQARYAIRCGDPKAKVASGDVRFPHPR